MKVRVMYGERLDLVSYAKEHFKLYRKDVLCWDRIRPLSFTLKLTSEIPVSEDLTLVQYGVGKTLVDVTSGIEVRHLTNELGEGYQILSTLALLAQNGSDAELPERIALIHPETGLPFKHYKAMSRWILELMSMGVEIDIVTCNPVFLAELKSLSLSRRLGRYVECYTTGKFVGDAPIGLATKEILKNAGVR